MRKTTILPALLLAATSGTAIAQTQAQAPVAATTAQAAAQQAPATAADTSDLGPDPTAPEPGGRTPGDPYEKLNRGIWGINQFLDRIIVKPVSQVYRTVFPRPVRRGITSAFANLSEPWSFVNNVLQARPKRAIRNLGRFVINSTVGIAGLIDQASRSGVRPAPEDFGQTLAKWGVKSSAYLVLPLLGPSTVRDGIGSGVAMVADPIRICLRVCTDLSSTARLGISAFQVITVRADLTDSGADAFLKSSLDPYATARSAYFQRRAAEIANRDDTDTNPDTGTPDASLDPTDPQAPPNPDPNAPPATPTSTVTPPAPQTDGSTGPSADASGTRAAAPQLSPDMLGLLDDRSVGFAGDAALVALR